MIDGTVSLCFFPPKIYEGDWHNDHQHGWGKLNLPFEDITFKGKFEDGKCPKVGMLINNVTSEIYIGQIEGNFKREGVGCLIYPNGDVYKGELSNDK